MIPIVQAGRLTVGFGHPVSPTIEGRIAPAYIVPKPDEIKRIRKHQGWTQADFADFFGLHPMTVSKWERLAMFGKLRGRLCREYLQLLRDALRATEATR